MADQPPAKPPPSSILIAGAGVFGLSTLHTLLLSARYATTSLHLLDPYLPPLPPPCSIPASDNTTPSSTPPPPPPPPQNPHAASIDTSRIIRADYAHSAYSRLAAEAQEHWRRGFGRKAARECDREEQADAEVVYQECGLVVTATRRGRGSRYVDQARANAEGLLGQEVRGIRGGERGVREVVGLPPTEGQGTGEVGEEEGDNVVGSLGYVNYVSGVANAGRAMGGVMEEVVRLCVARNEKVGEGGVGRVVFHRTGVSSLLTSPDASASNDGGVNLLGVVPVTGQPIYADLIILATGAWTPSLLDLRGRARVTAQVLAYLPLSEAEAALLRDMKILLNLGTGMFTIPPVKNAAGVWELKIARHGYGYDNPVEVELDATLVEPGLLTQGKRRGGRVVVEQSLPSQYFTPIPMEAEQACRGFLKQVFPSSSASPLSHLADRPFASTRLCWYTDTPKADFLVDFHPRIRSPADKDMSDDSRPRNLLIATGGSGHAFKFLPVLGEKIVARLEGRLEPGLADLWEWKEKRVEDDWGEVDGSRGGVKRMRLDEEWAKGRGRESKL